MILGAVLAGGASRRMGTDKALIEVGGQPMAAQVAGVLRAAGAGSVVLVGASRQTARALDLDTIVDQDPGSGPLGGLATALAWADQHGRPGLILLVAATDQPSLRAASLNSLVAALSDAGPACVAARFVSGDGRRHPLPSAWRVNAAAGRVRRLHDAGERRLGGAFTVGATLDLRSSGIDLVDLDTPAELDAWREQHVTLPVERRCRP